MAVFREKKDGPAAYNAACGEGVGKRKLVESWLDVYCESYDPTLLDAPSRKQIMLDRKACMYEVDSWGTDGEYPEVLAMCHYQAADCYALVYAATSRYSFDHLRESKQTLDSWSGEGMTTSWSSERAAAAERLRARLGAVIETKCDATEYREVQISEGIQLARDLGCPFYQTSAETRWNIDKVFDALGRKCRNVLERGELEKLQTSETIPSGPLVSQTSTGDMVKSKRYSIRRRTSSFHRRLGGPAGPR